MFPTPFRHFSPARQPWFRFEPGNDYGLIETQMAVSRDGIHWERPDRRPYFPMGLPDEWDRWMTMMGVGMVRRGNHLYQYYWSHRPDSRLGDPAARIRRYALAEERDRCRPPTARRFRVGRFRLLRRNPDDPSDRVQAAPIFGSIIDSGGLGTAFVEIRDAQARPIPGFGRDDCEEIGGNFVDTPVRWKGKSDLSALRGRPISLQISARAAKLYAFQFALGPTAD